MRDHYRATSKREKTKLVQSTGSSISGLSSKEAAKEVQGFTPQADAESGAIIAQVSFASCGVSLKYDSTISIVEHYEMNQGGRIRGGTKESRSCHVINWVNGKRTPEKYLVKQQRALKRLITC